MALAEYILYGPKDRKIVSSAVHNSMWFAAGTLTGPLVIKGVKSFLNRKQAPAAAQPQQLQYQAPMREINPAPQYDNVRLG